MSEAIYRLKKEPFQSPRRHNKVKYVAVVDFRTFKAGDVVEAKQTHTLRRLYDLNRIGIETDSWTKLSIEKFKQDGPRAVKSAYLVENPVPGRVTATMANRRHRHEIEMAEEAIKLAIQAKKDDLNLFIKEFNDEVKLARANGKLTPSKEQELLNLVNGKAVKDFFTPEHIDESPDFIKSCEEKLKVATGEQTKANEKARDEKFQSKQSVSDKATQKDDNLAQMDEKAPVAKSGSQVADELKELADKPQKAKKAPVKSNKKEEVK